MSFLFFSFLGVNINPHEFPDVGTINFTVATYEDDLFESLQWHSTSRNKLPGHSSAMSPAKEVDGVRGSYLLGPYDAVQVKKENILVGQQWEELAPPNGAQPSGLFNQCEFGSFHHVHLLQSVNHHHMYVG